MIEDIFYLLSLYMMIKQIKISEKEAKERKRQRIRRNPVSILPDIPNGYNTLDHQTKKFKKNLEKAVSQLFDANLTFLEIQSVIKEMYSLSSHRNSILHTTQIYLEKYYAHSQVPSYKYD